MRAHTPINQGMGERCMTAHIDKARLSTPPSRAFWRAASATITGAALVAGLAWSAAAQAQAPCIDVTRPISVEEQRLPNKLNALNANPFAVDILGASGFTHFEQDFIDEICGLNGKVAPSDYNSAFARMTEQGTRLWRAAVDRVQGRKVTQSDDLGRWPTLARGDDRPLYWARTTMTRALNRWVPMFPLSAAELTALQLQLERTSRGQLDIKFLAGSQYKRMIVSGFDVFTLPNPGTNGTGMRNSNPSAATVLTLDGVRTRLPDGTTLIIEAYVLPVNYPPFALGMVEDTVGPWMMPGPMRVDASVSMSQGGANQFWLEMWNGRFHGPTSGHDNIALAPCGNATTRRPQVNDCDVYPPERWMRLKPGWENYVERPLGGSQPWQRDTPPQFTVTSLPVAAMFNEHTEFGVPRPPNAGGPPPGAFQVLWHTNFTRFAGCDAVNGASSGTTSTVNGNQTPVAQEHIFPPSPSPTPPLVDDCAQSGGGGNYLSNEVAYRNTNMRDIFGLQIPAGHIHTPVVNNFAATPAGTAPLYTDSTYEAWRDAIVQQGRNLFFAVGRNLGPRPALPCATGPC